MKIYQEVLFLDEHISIEGFRQMLLLLLFLFKEQYKYFSLNYFCWSIELRLVRSLADNKMT